MKHFLDLSMISKSDLQNILSEAKRRKLKQSKLGKVIISEQSHAKDKLLLMVFEKLKKLNFLIVSSLDHSSKLFKFSKP